MLIEESFTNPFGVLFDSPFVLEPEDEVGDGDGLHFGADQVTFGTDEVTF